MLCMVAAAFNFVDEDMSGCLDSEEWRRFLDRFKSNVAVINMRSMFLHLDKVRIIPLGTSERCPFSRKYRPNFKGEAREQPFLPSPPRNQSPGLLTIQDMSGSVEVGELVPVIFNKASTAQHHLIRHLIEYENSMVRE